MEQLVERLLGRRTAKTRHFRHDLDPGDVRTSLNRTCREIRRTRDLYALHR